MSVNLKRLARCIVMGGEIFLGTLMVHALMQYGLDMKIFELRETFMCAGLLGVLTACRFYVWPKAMQPAPDA